MSYPSPYQSPQQGCPSSQPGYASPQGYPAAGGGYPGPGGGYPAQPRKRRGIKRIIVGSIGMVLNFIGLFVMPLVVGILVAGISVASTTPQVIGSDSGTFSASSFSLHGVGVPADEVAGASCEIDGQDIQVDDTADDDISLGDIDSVEYVEIHDVSAYGAQDITVECTGTTSVAVLDYGLAGTALGMGAGLLIPIGLGTLSFILLVWGVIARVRS